MRQPACLLYALLRRAGWCPGTGGPTQGLVHCALPGFIFCGSSRPCLRGHWTLPLRLAIWPVCPWVGWALFCDLGTWVETFSTSMGIRAPLPYHRVLHLSSPNVQAVIGTLPSLSLSARRELSSSRLLSLWPSLTCRMSLDPCPLSDPCPPMPIWLLYPMLGLS